MNNNVRAWREAVSIPTYGIGEPEKNPIFLEKRVYQGSSGVVYPYPVIEKIMDEKVDKVWNAIYLENKYLKIMILPELGGRVQMAFDKIKQRHFVYYNQVIKPAVVGLTGPWISGGIEFNWPQHHRPTTYDPVDSFIEENKDGSVTVWCSELERMFRTKGMAGFTLHPDKAYLEIKVQLYNPTPHPQTFLWWANPAVKVNDDYQSVFPPDVNAVFDHGKRDVSSFPIATGTYYKVDYSAGVDISRYKNIPVPTSYMAIQSKYNFVGGFENDSQGGLLHVADHNQSPGKKQWTWGHSDFGQAWDRNLTDEDGPYIELMCGVYTDNQPDFSWLQPYEEKSFKQYFMPYRDLGVVKNATKEAMLNLEFEEGKSHIMVYATSEYPQTTICLKTNGKILFEKVLDLSPEMSFDQVVEGDVNPGKTYISVVDNTGKVLVDWQTEAEELKPIPDPAKAAKDPEEINSTEQLYLRGLHLEQYRHATYNPTDYYLEALRREPGDVRNNNAMGLWLMRRGQLTKAEPYFRRAIETLTERNPNPYDGEPLYNLGVCLRMQNKLEEAYGAFFKSTWNGAWQDSGFFHAARIDAIRGDYEKALELTDRSLWRNWLNQKARHLKIALLRILNRNEEALTLIEESLKMDRFNFGALYEKYQLSNDPSVLMKIQELMRDNVHNYIEYSLDYAGCGLYGDAIDFISLYLDGKDTAYPMAWYLKGDYLLKSNKTNQAAEAFNKAGRMAPDYCFPNKLEELVALKEAVKINQTDAKAWYYMGNFWYGARQYEEALECWEKSRDLDDNFPTVHRNLALAYYNKQNDSVAARQSLEKAFELDTSDARVLMELDQLYKKLNVSPSDRLSLLDKYPELVNFRDDLYLERTTLFNLLDQEEKALKLIMDRKFHPWEGGEGKVTGQYLYSHVELAKKALANGNFQKAIDHLEATFEYPHNLGEGKLFGAQENDTNYWLGCAYDGLGETEKANAAWEAATTGLSEPTAAMYYNDQQPDKIFYQGLALLKLGRNDEANSRFNKLLKHGEKQLFIPFKMDYFAVSLPDLLIFEEDLQKRHEMHCHYLMGLGHLGLNHLSKASTEFQKVLKVDSYHLGALIHKKMIIKNN
jgi:tetratricopeptide (TPR) repeat protein